MQFNVGGREIVLKVVYYGPPLSGKTTNLQMVHKLLNPELCGRLTTLDTSDDRTLFFDLLPVVYKAESDTKLKLKLYTVPGQVVHAATRRVVLAGADGIIFVADSQIAEAATNNEYWHGMRHYLEESGVDWKVLPTVIQFNKRDMPEVRTAAEMAEIKKNSAEPVYEAVAVRGDGVLETLRGVLELIFADLNRRYDFEKRFKISATHYLDTLFTAKRPEAP